MEGLTLEKLQVIIEAYTKPYRDEVEKLKRQTTTAASHVERQTARMRNSFKKIGAIIASVLSIGALIAFGKSCIDLGSDLAEVQNVVDVTFGTMSGAVDSFAKNAITQFGLSELTAKKYMGTYGAMAKSFGIVEEAGYQMSASITGLTGDVASFYNLSTDEAYTKLKSIFTGETESLKELGVVMTQTALDQYALNNGFGKTTAKMTEQEKVMLRYRFVMNALSDAQGDFARTSDSWANQTRVLALQFESLRATIGQGLINAFTPVIRVINIILAKLQTLAAYFRAFTSALFGDAGGSNDAVSGAASSMASAAGSSGDVADNMGAAAKSAKDMKNSLAAFDELNNLSGDSGSGGSGGSGGGGAIAVPDFGNFDWDDDALVEKFKQQFDGLYSIGEYIGSVLTNALNEIDWDNIYQGSRNFGKGFAEFLNGLISPELFGATGRAIAGALNMAIYAALSFGQTFEWDGLGLSIATGINQFFNTFDFASAGVTATVFAKGFLDTILSAIENTDWYMIGTRIGEFFANIDWGTIVAKAGKLIIEAVGAAIGLYSGMINVAPLETSIMTGIAAFKFVGVGKVIMDGITKSLAGGIRIGEIALIIGQFTLAGISLPALDVIGNEIIAVVEGFIKENFGEAVTNAMGDGLLIIVAAGIGTLIGGPIGTFVGAVIGTIVDAFISEDSLGAKIGATLFNFDFSKQIFNDAKEALKKAFAANNFAEFGYWIVEGIVGGIIGALAFIGEPFADLFDAVVTAICNVFGIHSPAEEMKPYGGYILAGIIEGFRATFGEWTQALNDWYVLHIAPWFTTQKWSSLYDTIKTSLKTKWDEAVNNWSSGISSWWSNDVTPWFTLDKWKTEAGHIKESISSTWTETVSDWKARISNWWIQDVTTWFTKEKWQDALGGVKEGIGAAFESAFDGVKQIWNKFAKWLNEKLTFKIDPVTIMGQEIFGGATIDLGKVPTFATGGFPAQGQMFIARENGPEMVGRIGNRNAVVNNDQIIDGVSKGVYMAVSNAGGMNEDVLYRAFVRALKETDLTAVMDSDRVFKTMQKKAEEYSSRTRKPAFGW